MKTLRLFAAVTLLIMAAEFAQAQSYLPNVITTAVPFLTYSPDARAAAMGECGVATEADAFSMFYNPAKYAFMKNEHTMIASGINLWPRYITTNFPLYLYGSFAQKIGKSAIAVTLRHYRANEIEIRDQYNQPLGLYSPREIAFDASYSYRFGDYLSAGLAVRLISSNMAQGTSDYARPGLSFAGDIGVYYNRPLGRVVDLSLGASIANIGTKMNYSSSNRKDFLPTTMRLGTGVKLNFHPKHSLAFNMQFSKLLVPTPPIRDMQTDAVIYGYDDDVSVVAGMLHSFYDAPGYSYNPITGVYDNIGKFYEELCEINLGFGLEYNLADHFFVRNGFYHRPALKGGGNYLCSGLGMHFGIFGMDVSYAIPVNTVVGYNQHTSVFRWDMYFAF